MTWQMGRLGDADVPELVRFWNAEFGSWRMFRPLTEEWLRIRVMGRAAFDPTTFFIARVGDAIAALGHASCQRDTSYLSLLYVAPRYRRQGIGTALMSCLQPALDSRPRRGAAAVVFDPVYGTDFDAHGAAGLRCRPAWGGPRYSLFGASEGIGVPTRDLETVGFLLKRGFSMTSPDLSMRLDDIRRGEFEQHELANVKGRRYDIQAVENESAWGSVAYQYENAHHSARLLRGDAICGGLTWFKWDETTAILYDFSLQEELRGKGLGRALLSRALGDMAAAGCTACELNTGSERNARAVGIYRAAGFRIAEAWQTFSGAPR